MRPNKITNLVKFFGFLPNMGDDVWNLT